MVSDGEPWERNGAMSQTMTVSEVREIYPRPEGAAVQKRWRKLDRFMSAFIKRSPFLCLSTANAAGALSQRTQVERGKVSDSATIVPPPKDMRLSRRNAACAIAAPGECQESAQYCLFHPVRGKVWKPP